MIEEGESEEVSDELPESNNATKFFIIGALIGLVIILGVLFALPSRTGPNTVDYNYFTFTEVEGFWETSIERDAESYLATFRYNPEQVEDVYVTGNFSGFTSKPIYITFDPEAEEEQFKYLALAASELTLHLIRGLDFEVEAACTKNKTEACLDRPIVNCGDENTSVILLNPTPPEQLTLDNHCITLSGHELGLLKGVDRLLFQWYKIIR